MSPYYKGNIKFIIRSLAINFRHSINDSARPFYLCLCVMLHSRFLADCCNWRVGCRTLKLYIIHEINVNCTTLLIYVIVYECWLSTNLNNAVKLLTFVNEKFYSEMLATRFLVPIDEVKGKMKIYEL